MSHRFFLNISAKDRHFSSLRYDHPATHLPASSCSTSATHRSSPTGRCYRLYMLFLVQDLSITDLSSFQPFSLQITSIYDLKQARIIKAPKDSASASQGWINSSRLGLGPKYSAGSSVLMGFNLVTFIC